LSESFFFKIANKESF